MILLLLLAVTAAAADLRLISCNVAKKDATRVRAELHASERLRESALLLLQEMEDPALPAAFADRYEHRADTGRGLAVLSRYPILSTRVVDLPVYRLHYKQTRRLAQILRLQTPGGAVSLINVHLDNRLNTDDKLAQLRPVLEVASGLPAPVIVGGDFNTGNFYWVKRVFPVPYGQRQNSAVVEAMRSQGFETPFGRWPTFDFLGLRLDYIFLRGLTAIEQGVVPLKFSDHHAIWLHARIP